VSHLASAGFQRSEGDAKELISTAVDRATEVVEHADGKTATYRDPSGATLTVHLSDEGDLHCVKPGFEGDSRARWRPVAVTRDPECRFCDFVCAELLEEDEPVYPFVLSVVTIGSDRALIPYGEPGDVRFTGLWENGELWQDEEAFRRAEEAEWGDVEVPEATARRDSCLPRLGVALADPGRSLRGARVDDAARDRARDRVVGRGASKRARRGNVPARAARTRSAASSTCASLRKPSSGRSCSRREPWPGPPCGSSGVRSRCGRRQVRFRPSRDAASCVACSAGKKPSPVGATLRAGS
jgi:hypothetical protein